MTPESLQVAGWPAADLLADVLGERAQVIRRIVTSQADVERLGMTGSPKPGISLHVHLDSHQY